MQNFAKCVKRMIENRRIIARPCILGALTIVLASCAGLTDRFADIFADSLSSAESVQRRIDDIARIARENGYTEAAGLDAMKIGKTFEEGKVVPKDFVLAHAWYKVAARLFSTKPTKCTVKWQGQCQANDSWASSSAKLAVQIRQQMTSEEVQRSNKLADDCIKSRYQSCPGVEQ